MAGHPADVASLQQDDGSFAGDEWGEIDTRSVRLTMLLPPILFGVGHQLGLGHV